MKAFNSKNRNIPLLEQESIKMEKSGNIERYAIEKLIQKLNCNDKFYYDFIPTSSDKKIGYEGIIYVKNKLTDKKLDMYIIEAKVRNNNVKQDDLFYEKKKHNTLKLIKKILINEGSMFEPKILYVNFCFDGTFMFFIDDLIFNGTMPKLTKIKMNKVTVTSTNDKINKQVYLLSKTLAVKKDYIYNPIDYANYLLDVSMAATTEAKEVIKKYYSLF